MAQALACLEKPVVHVGGEGQVPKGTSDQAVALSAKQQRRVLVTFNFDMVLTACETGYLLEPPPEAPGRPAWSQVFDGWLANRLPTARGVAR